MRSDPILNSFYRWALVSIFCIFCVEARAQHTSTLGRFEIDENLGCAPFTVNITNLLPGNCLCDVVFGDGNEIQIGTTDINTSYTYTTPGIYTLRVVYRGITPAVDTIQLQVLENIRPDFDIFRCAGSRAQIRINDNNYEEYVVDYDNDGIPEDVVVPGQPVIEHNYGTPGNYNISVRGRNLNAADNCNSNIRPVQAVNTLSAGSFTSLTPIDATQLALNYNIAPHFFYRLQIAVNSNSAFQFLRQIPDDVDAAVISNLDLEDLDYCFRIETFDPCNNVSQFSEPICTVDMDLDAQDSQIAIAWNSFDNTIADTRIRRDNVPNFVSNPPQNPFIDTDVDCNIQYCYQVTLTNGSGATSQSLEKCETAFNSVVPGPVEDLTLAVSDGNRQIDLFWNAPIGSTLNNFSILRGQPSPLGNLVDVDAPPFSDLPVNAEETQYCYQVNYTDECGNNSAPGVMACTIFLTGELNENNEPELSWNAYDGWLNGVSQYRVERLDVNGAPAGTLDAGTNTTIADEAINNNQVVQYRIVAMANDVGIPNATSNIITVIKNPNLFHPNAFTPNDDGLNDEFFVRGSFIRQYDLKIFSRWGELLFVSDDPDQGWDGTLSGKKLPQGTYAFIAKVVDEAGREITKTGTILLLRK